MMTTRFLSPLGWILNGLVFVLFGWSVWSSVSSGQLSGDLAPLITCCGLGSMLCLAYAPQTRRLVSPLNRKILILSFTCSAVVLVWGMVTSLSRARIERERAALSSELERDIAGVQAELKRFDSKAPTRRQLDLMTAEMREIESKRARLKAMTHR